MGEPLSPDRVFDFPVDEPEPHPTYDFFAPGPLPGYAGNPNNNNGWIEAGVPLLGELGKMGELQGAEVDKPMAVPAIEEVAEPIDEAKEQMIALVVDMDEELCWELKVFTLSTTKPKTLYCSGLQLPILTKNGNSFKPAAQTTTNVEGTSTTLIPGPVTADEKTQKKNNVKARSMLLMTLLNEHLLTFNQYKDAKTLFAAIQTRFGCYDATKKTQKTLLKQINKAKLVARGYTQEEGIDYDVVFTPVARIKTIRLFLAYASFKDFVVYQMDVKSSFLYGKIEEEVYVCQPLGFEDPKFPDKVYKVEKTLYGLHQAPRAWYETPSTYLLDNGFKRGQIDKTLFIKRIKSDILLVQVYVDDIIFGSTKKELCADFENQDKYVDEILKKFSFSTVKTASTPMETSKPLLEDAEAEDVDVHLYRSMIGSLMYLTASRLDIIFVLCSCARFQVIPKVSHLHAVKRIFRYLKGQPKLGLWYPKDSPFDLEAYTDSDYAGASLDRKSTT
ncbi:putative ribonuclease H-like domain-containing protein [Tanacetum coccineum]